MSNNLGIKEKSRVGQFFCKHKNTRWFVENKKGFQIISGEKRLHICKDCGKVIGECFMEYEGMGYK